MPSRLLATLLLAVTLGAASARAELVDRIVAIVDRDVILLSEAEQARAVARARGGEEATLTEIVDRLIEARLVEREVDRFRGEPVPSRLVDDALEEIRARSPSEEAFVRTLRESGLSLDALRSALERQLTIQRYLERRFRALSFVTDDEVETYYRNELPRQVGSQDLPDRAEVADLIRRLLEERKFNQRVEEWIEGLESRARVRRYVW